MSERRLKVEYAEPGACSRPEGRRGLASDPTAIGDEWGVTGRVDDRRFFTRFQEACAGRGWARQP
jgi:hypothetical protein